MKKLTLLLSLFFVSLSVFARSDSLADGMRPKKYRKRDRAVYDVALVYYGDTWNESDMQRIAPLLKERFESSTKGEIQLNIAHIAALPYKHKIENYPDYRSGDITDPTIFLLPR